MLELRFVDYLTHEVIDSSWVISDTMIGLVPLPDETVTLHIGDDIKNYIKV